MTNNSTRPRFGRIAAAIQYSGFGRSTLYKKAAEHVGLFRRDGTSILVDFDILDQILDALPVAQIKPAPERAHLTASSSEAV